MSHLKLRGAYRGFRKNKSGYTLIELAITLAVILLLSSIGIWAYQSVLASARKTVCKTNLKALGTAIENYVLENDALPATLGRLRLKHLEKGYAKAMDHGGWVTEISLFLIKLDESDNAYAKYLTPDNLKQYGVSGSIFHCPVDGNGGASYAINGELESKRWPQVDKDDILAADCDNYVFTALDQLAKRHHHQALAVTKSGRIVELPGADSATADAGADADADTADVGADTDADVDADTADAGADVDADTGTDDADTNEDEETICHKPGTPSEKTLTKSGSALEAHLAHGDTVGACP